MLRKLNKPTAKQITIFVLAFAVICIFTAFPAFAADVSGAIEATWNAAKGQIKTVVNNVVFPVVDVVLAVLFFVKIGTAYFDCAPVKVI